MSSTYWFSQLDRAKSIAETVAVARDFIATLSPEDLALLPEACRPGRLRDETDIEALHATLVEAYRTSRSSGRELEVLERLTSFTVRASIRLAELGEPSPSGPTNGPTGGSPRSFAPRDNRDN